MNFLSRNSKDVSAPGGIRRQDERSVGFEAARSEVRACGAVKLLIGEVEIDPCAGNVEQIRVPLAEVTPQREVHCGRCVLVLSRWRVDFQVSSGESFSDALVTENHGGGLASNKLRSGNPTPQSPDYGFARELDEGLVFAFLDDIGQYLSLSPLLTKN